MYTQYILQISPLAELLCFTSALPTTATPLAELLCFTSALPTTATFCSNYLNFNPVVLELNVLCELHKTRAYTRAA